jgi:hypothetical protein
VLKKFVVLKWRGFSRRRKPLVYRAALAAEGMPERSRILVKSFIPSSGIV